MTHLARTPSRLVNEHARSTSRCSVTLRDVLVDGIDRSGPVQVAKQLGQAVTTVYNWFRKGRISDTDFQRTQSGGTSYSDCISSMQRISGLAPGAIRLVDCRL